MDRAYRLLDVVHGHAGREVSVALRRRGDRNLETSEYKNQR